MTRETAPHLDRNELNMAAIDAADMAPERRVHLNACDSCRGEVERFRGELAALGRLAADLAPLPRQPVHLPVAAPRQRFWRLQRWPAAIAATVTVVLFAFCLHQFANPVREAGVTAPQLAEGDLLMEEVGWLAEDALPESYQAMTATDGFDLEEFMEFVVPSPEDDPLSYTPIRKGDRLC